MTSIRTTLNHFLNIYTGNQHKLGAPAAADKWQRYSLLKEKETFRQL